MRALLLRLHLYNITRAAEALTSVTCNRAIASPSVGSAIREVSQTCCGASWRKPNGIGIRRLDEDTRREFD